VESTEKDIDLLIATALTEEAQVVSAVMSRVAKEHHKRGHVIVHEYFLGDGTAARVATASAHQMGAVNMGVFIAPLLNDLRPRSTTLVGIAAAIDAGEVALGDVPFASQVLSYDDVAVEASTLTFRTEGYPVDPRMRHAVGALRTSRSAYAPWQDECLAVIGGVIEDVSRLRRRAVKRPEAVEPPHLVVGVTAGGPFLLRDRGFSDSLREHPKERELAGARIGVAAPVHPKLVSAEMESHGFMRAAHEHGVPATVIKGISDVGDQEKASLEKETGGFYRAFACSNAVLAALHILRHAEPRNLAPSRAPEVRSYSVAGGGSTTPASSPLAGTEHPPDLFGAGPRRAPEPHRVFVGRDAELKRIAAALDGGGGGRVAIVAVQGMAGVGKTYLAHEFYAQYPGRFGGYQHVVLAPGHPGNGGSMDGGARGAGRDRSEVRRRGRGRAGAARAAGAGSRGQRRFRGIGRVGGRAVACARRRPAARDRPVRRAGDRGRLGVDTSAQQAIARRILDDHGVTSTPAAPARSRPRPRRTIKTLGATAAEESNERTVRQAGVIIGARA